MGFTEQSESPYIFRYEKGGKKAIRTNIKNVAQEAGFYSDEVEQFLADKVESPSKPVLTAIRNRQQITPKDRRILVSYMVVMIIRVPRSKEARINWLKQNTHPYLDALEKEIKWLYESHPDKRDILSRRFQELAKLRAEGKPKPEEIWQVVMSPEAYPKVSWALENMTWQFKTRKEDTFLTSDNPFFFFRELGLGRKTSEFYFPISTTVSLWGSWRSKSFEGYNRATDGFVHEMNRRIASAATKYVFFSKESESLVGFVNKPNHRIRYLVTA
jgi:hypothetical protein